MNDASDTLPKPRRRSRKATEPAAATAETGPVPEVQAILDQALHATEAVPEGDTGAAAPAPPVRAARKRRRRAAKGEAPAVPATRSSVEQVIEPAAAQTGVSVDAAADPDEAPAAPPGDDRADADRPGDDRADPATDSAPEETAARDLQDDPPPEPFDSAGPPGAQAPPPGGEDRDVPAAAAPPPHRWVYLAVAVFLLSLGFGLWGVWTTFFASADDDRSAAALRAGHETLSQEVTILRRSDQISRDANRDLERTLAERDEEIAGLRADVAFYERFVGATGQRRGLSVHDLEVRLQSGEVWHFVATLTQNVNRGAVNSGRVTLSVEGTRNDRLERLSWSALRKQNNAPGQPYSFKYFEQVEGEVMLPQGFKPLRVTVRLVPQGGSAVEQSFPWPDAVRSATAGD